MTEKRAIKAIERIDERISANIYAWKESLHEEQRALHAAKDILTEIVSAHRQIISMNEVIKTKSSWIKQSRCAYVRDL